MPLAFPSGTIVGAAVAKDSWNLFPFFFTVANNNNTGTKLEFIESFSL